MRESLPKALRKRYRYVVIRGNFQDVIKKIVETFGNLSLEEMELKLIKEFDSVFVVACRREMVDLLLIALGMLNPPAEPIRVCGSIRKVRKVIEECCQNKCLDMTEP